MERDGDRLDEVERIDNRWATGWTLSDGELSWLITELRTALSGLRDARAENERLTRERREHANYAQRLINECGDLRVQLDEAREATDAAHADWVRVVGQLGAAEVERDEARAEVERLRNDLADLWRVLTAAERERDELRRDCTSQESDLMIIRDWCERLGSMWFESLSTKAEITARWSALAWCIEHVAALAAADVQGGETNG